MLFRWMQRYPRIGLTLWWAFLMLALAGLEAAGHGGLRAPPLAHPAQWGMWMHGQSALTVVFAGTRLVAMGLAWYLLATTTMGVVLRGLALVRLVHLADAVTVPAVRQVLAGAVGLSLSAASVVGTAGQAGAVTRSGDRAGGAGGAPPAAAVALAPPAPDHSTALMTRLPSATTHSGAATRAAGAPTSGAGRTQSASPPTTSVPLAPGGVASPPTTRVPPAPRQTWVIRPGDNLWSMAELSLARAWHRAPTDSEVDRYWLRLIQANRSRLADPLNPDLIFAGQVFDLPPPR